MITFNQKNLTLARRAAAEGMVLLKNEHSTLPLCTDRPVALFGRDQLDTVKGGGGSANVWAVPVVSFAEGIERQGKVYAPLLARYRAWDEANRDVTRRKCYRRNDPVSLPEYPITEREVSDAAAACDTAVFFIGRYATEHFDLRDVPGEYRISAEEQALLTLVTKHFKKTLLVLNLPGLMDLSFLEACPTDAILYTGLPGMEAGNALADLLYGSVTPCGKLPDTWASTLADYPSHSEDFGTNRIVYREGIYMGYRYFDTFGQDVVFPFGFGLSYTDFSYDVLPVTVENTVATVRVRVTNRGKYSGREVVQCYLSVPDGTLDQPRQVLCGFEKTALLAPTESETVTVRVDLLDFTSYCEARASYILETGTYILRVGRHSRDTAAVCAIRVARTVIHRTVKNRLVPTAAVELLKKPITGIENCEGLPLLTADFSEHVTEILPDHVPVAPLPASVPCTFADVLTGRRTPEELVAQLTDEELALALTGDGKRKRREAGITPNEPIAKGEGSHSHPIPRLGIPASTMQDGPAGVRASDMPWPLPPTEEINGNDCICYPCATLLAATWDRRLLREIGAAVTDDLARYRFNGWCAPGVNLHRHPLCGRNFEYLSEDPFLAAELAREEIVGIQENPDGTPTGHYAILKHFACNNAETLRLESDSVLTERTARELYLRVFEYVIRRYQPLSVMTSYNKINGEYAAARADLLDGICRTEWGYKGWIMTDWDVRAAAESFIRAGVDIEMPGRVISPRCFTDGTLDRATAQRRVVHLIRLLMRTKHHDVK